MVHCQVCGAGPGTRMNGEKPCHHSLSHSQLWFNSSSRSNAIVFWGFACSAKLRMDRGMGEDGTRATSQPMFVWAESSSVSKVSPFSVDAE